MGAHWQCLLIFVSIGAVFVEKLTNAYYTKRGAKIFFSFFEPEHLSQRVLQNPQGAAHYCNY